MASANTYLHFTCRYLRYASTVLHGKAKFVAHLQNESASDHSMKNTATVVPM
jgi:hypothetical protein